MYACRTRRNLAAEEGPGWLTMYEQQPISRDYHKEVPSSNVKMGDAMDSRCSRAEETSEYRMLSFRRSNGFSVPKRPGRRLSFCAKRLLFDECLMVAFGKEGLGNLRATALYSACPRITGEVLIMAAPQEANI